MNTNRLLLAGVLLASLLPAALRAQIVSGPLVSTNRSVAVFQSANGKLIGSSPVMIDVVGNMWFAGPGTLIVSDMTTAERNTLSSTNGMVIYNSTTSQFERYQAGAWGPFGTGSGGTNGTPEYVNGIVLAGPINLTNSSTLTWSVTGTNVSATPANLTSAQLATDSVSADELNALGVEAELEAVLDLQDLQGSVANAQISANAAIAKTKISTNGAWLASELGTGTADTNSFLRGDLVWSRNAAGLTNLTTSNLVNLAAGAVLVGQGAGPVGGVITSNTNYTLHGGSSPVFGLINLATDVDTNVLSLANGGLGVVLSDPNADRIPFWDDSAGRVGWLTVGSGLNITGTTITSTGGAAEVFTNANNLFSANASNVFNGPIRMVGRRQFSWTPLGGTTIDGSTNSLTTTLTANTTLTWTGVDGDEVVLEVLQDGTGGRTLAVNNVDVWWTSTNQSTTMPGIATNAGYYSWVTLWRRGSTDFGSVSTAPTQWEVDWATQNATSAKVAAAVTDESGTGSLLFGTSPTITTPTISGAISFPDGVRQTFNPNGTTPSLNVGAQAGDPSGLLNGDLWYDSTGNLMRARINGATVSLGVGASPGGADGDVQYKSGSVLGAESAFNYNSTNDTLSLSNLTFSGKLVGLGNTNGTWTLWDGAGTKSVIIGAPPTVTTNYVVYYPAYPTATDKFLVGINTGTTNTNGAAIIQLVWTNTAAGGGGNVTNTGASVVSQVPRYTDTSGTQIAPSTMKVASGGGVIITNGTSADIALDIQGLSGGTNKIFNVGTNGVISLAVAPHGGVLIGAGTAARPGLGFAGDDDGTGTGFTQLAANMIDFVGNGTHWARLSGATGFTVAGQLGLGNSATTPDTYIYRGGAANIIQLGADGATPAAQLFKGPNGLGTDKNGGNLTIEGGISTGTGAGGAVIFKSAESSTTSSSLNGTVNRFYMSPKGVDLTGGSATLVFNVSLASGKTCGLHVFATTRANDGTDFQSATDDFTCAAVNKGGTVSIGSLSTSLGSTIATAGTISTVWTAVANGNGIDVKCNETSTVITPTVRKVKWRVEVDTDDTASTITPQ